MRRLTPPCTPPPCNVCLAFATDEGLKWIQAGGNVDLTATSSRTVGALAKYFAAGGDDALSHVSVSSDAYGSLPHFDAAGALESYSYAAPDGIHRLIRTMVRMRTVCPP